MSKKNRPGAVQETAEIEQLEPDSNNLDSFIKLVGQRVQQARKQQRMSRRVLSENSGVSQRTIVLLESGVGNISIALLFRLSNALGRTVQSFMVQDSTAEQREASQIAGQYLNATQTSRQKIADILKADKNHDAKQKRICLIGLRGAGKSTLGKNLSDITGTRFIELNDEIEALSGMSVQELMDLYGLEGYRKLEQQALVQACNQSDDIIIAAAGGVVNDEETYNYLLKHFHTVWLKAAPEEHISRVRDQGDERPMAGNPEAMTVLRSILVSREAHYQMADRTVDTSGRSVKDSTAELADTVGSLLIATTRTQ